MDQPQQGRHLKDDAGIDDLDLVARARSAGDSRAYGELVRRHQSRVRVFLLRLTRDPTLADDLAQEAFLAAWQKLADFRGDGAFGGWLMRIAWTTFLQARRKQDRYREVVEQAAREEATAPAARPSDEVTDLDRLLAVLGEEERAVLVMSYACGLSHREIGEACGLPVGTVKSIIFRAKERIRQDFAIQNHQLG